MVIFYGKWTNKPFHFDEMRLWSNQNQEQFQFFLCDGKNFTRFIGGMGSLLSSSVLFRVHRFHKDMYCRTHHSTAIKDSLFKLHDRACSLYINSEHRGKSIHVHLSYKVSLITLLSQVGNFQIHLPPTHQPRLATALLPPPDSQSGPFTPS